MPETARATEVALKAQLVHQKMTKHVAEHQPKVHVDGKGETKSHIYTVHQDTAIKYYAGGDSVLF